MNITKQVKHKIICMNKNDKTIGVKRNGFSKIVSYRKNGITTPTNNSKEK